MAELQLTGTMRATHAVVSVMQKALVTGEFISANEVVRHKGRFDTAEELSRFALKNNVIGVAALKASNHDRRAGSKADISMVAYVVTRGAAKDMDASVVCELLTSKVIELVSRERWGVHNCSEAKNIIATNLYSATPDGFGVCIWAVSWVQNMSMSEPIYTTLDDFTTLGIKNQLAESGSIDKGAPTIDALIHLPGETDELSDKEKD
ncbi:hypothetical protein [Vibrio scophthalmi]|uniref:Uncharacterized protein n=1 Tax=Vibrio scophthalmi LMG 19158 TaxID=870967 RepID=F9RKK1_9VIBR|nr:hypothetical protein [Vibrio scophthalmi]EGU39600.1 hypothetical protein VIS19158_15169 [Vibrio scophthalmi LMG 19158]